MKKKIVILSPLYNESDNIKLFLKTLSHVLTPLTNYEFQYLFVDDGSTDESFFILKEICLNNKLVSVIKLSRNFGSHTAIFAGLETLKQLKKIDAVIIMSIDLQDPPELIPHMLKKLDGETRVVWGVRKKRKDNVFGTLFSDAYYFLIRKYALPNMPTQGMDFCVIDRQVVADLIQTAEKNTSLMALILWLGYKQKAIPYTRKSRLRGTSHWTLIKKTKLFIDTFVAFSYVPIWLVSYLGFVLAGLGFLYGIVVFTRRLLYGAPIEGWSSLMLVVLILSGVQLLMLGIVAEYLWRTLDASRKRPIYVVDKKLNIKK